VTFLLYWCRKDTGAPLCIISGRHLSRTTNHIPYTNPIHSFEEIIKVPCAIWTKSVEGQGFKVNDLNHSDMDPLKGTKPWYQNKKTNLYARIKKQKAFTGKRFKVTKLSYLANEFT
jgi:hypothetical protein